MIQLYAEHNAIHKVLAGCECAERVRILKVQIKKTKDFLFFEGSFSNHFPYDNEV